MKAKLPWDGAWLSKDHRDDLPAMLVFATEPGISPREERPQSLGDHQAEKGEESKSVGHFMCLLLDMSWSESHAQGS